LEREVGWAAAPTDATAAALEKRYMHAAFAACLDDRFLCLVQLPCRAQAADILRRIRVTNHHLLSVSNRFPVLGNFEDMRNDLWRAAKILRGFKQRDNPERLFDAGGPLQELDGQNV